MISIAVMTVIMVVLLHRLFNLQIVRGEEFQNTFQLRIRKEKDVAATRGNIYDRNGNLLAYNELANTVMIEDVFESGRSRNRTINTTINRLLDIIERNGDEILGGFNVVLNADDDYEFDVEDTAKERFLADVYGRTYTKDLQYEEKIKTPAEVVDDLCVRYGIGDYTDPEDRESFVPGMGYDKERILKLITIRYNMSANSYQKYIDIPVAGNVSDRTVADVMENAPDLPGVSIEEETARRYVDAEYFSQIIGYTGKVSVDELESLREINPEYDLNDTVGKVGIEQSMETILQGTKGSETLYVDQMGKVIQRSDYIDSVSGNDVYLTIDKELQIAAYNIVEERLAGILVSKIRNIKEYNGGGGADMVIPIYDVYNALFNNYVIDIPHLASEDAGPYEKAVHQAYVEKEMKVFTRLEDEMTRVNTPYEDLSLEYKNYQTYLVQLLYNDGILQRDKVDPADETYIAWTTEETIPLSEFLYYAIGKNWINVSRLNMDDQYSNSDEIFTRIMEYAFENMKENTDFVKKLFKYMLDEGAINGTQVCHVLIEQGKVNVEEEELNRLNVGAISAYTFMVNRISALDITPAQLNLDPCTGSMVITDVNTGDVLALVSYPSYDNNKMANGVDAAYFAELRRDLSRPLINYATQQRIAPGSTFKMVSATAGLMEGVISTGTVYSCHGLFDVFTQPPRCWIYPGGHGGENVTTAIKDSCNVFFYNVGYNLGLTGDSYSSDLGLEKLKKYADLYGLTQKSGVEIEEMEPQFSDIDSVRSAIGQGSNAYTTAGLARYVTTVANRGTCYDLTLIDRITDPSGNLLEERSAAVKNTIDMDVSYWNAIQSGMRQVVLNQSYYKDVSVSVAGKTGTAQENLNRANHAVFVCYAPYETPEIAIATRIANGYTSSYAAQITRDVISYYFNLTDEEELITGTAQTLQGGAVNAD